MHSSLLRILTPEQLSKGAIFAINQVCQQWTDKLRGTQLSLPEAWCALPATPCADLQAHHLCNGHSRPRDELLRSSCPNSYLRCRK